MTAPTIADRYDPNSNGITPLRLLLAIAVIGFHAWPIGGFGPDPTEVLTGYRLDGGGTLAVLGFFGLSGFLLAESRQRSSAVAFAWRRAARILPGYWACVVFVGFIAGVDYVRGAWLPFEDVTRFTTSVFGSNPWPSVNASLWTLWPEILGYAWLAAIPARFVSRATPIVFVVMSVGHLLAPNASILGHLPLAFAAGAVLSVWRDRIPLTVVGVLAGGIATFLADQVGLGILVGPMAAAYAVIWLAVSLPFRWSSDLSYGVYLYGWPVAQVLVVGGVARLGLPIFAASTALVAIAIGWISWTYLERPAMSAARRTTWNVGRISSYPEGRFAWLRVDVGPVGSTADATSAVSTTDVA